MLPSIKDAFSFSSGGGAQSFDLGDNSSATGGNQTFGNMSGPAVNGTVKDKSWLFGGGGQQSEKTGYYIGAAVTSVLILGAVLFAVKGRK
jgi:hypothetical protein